MRILLVNQYYPPDQAPTGLMLEAVVEELARQGHEVTVICSVGGYAELENSAAAGKAAEPQVGKVHVIRLGASKFGRASALGRMADYLSFYLGVAWKILFIQPRPDRVIALTTPPLLSILARVGSWIRRADHGHWVMDLYPDVMVAHGMLREGCLLHRVLAQLARFGFGGQRGASMVTLGPDMAERVANYLPPGRKADWIPLWSTEEDGGDANGVAEAAGRHLRHERGWADDELVFMYSGNMGRGHRFEEFLAAAGDLPERNSSEPSVRFVFYGGGKRRSEIEHFIDSHPDGPVELHDYVPREELAGHLRSANVHLVSLEPAWDGTMVPSKLQGIFGAGRPVLFVGSKESSIGRWILESGGGWVVEPNDGSALSSVMKDMESAEERGKRGEAARRFASAAFAKKVNVSRVAELFLS